jgi:hypothetical protein
MIRLLVIALFLVLVSCAFRYSHPQAGRTYYVSPRGNDHASGRDPQHSWRTVGRVNAATLRPGDRVLFKAGATFNDSTLTPRASGTSGKPIRFSSYGRGRAIISNGAGAVWFTGQSYLVFERLQLTTGNANAVIFAGSSQPSTDIVINHCALFSSNYAAINQPNPDDARWLVSHSTIEHVGDSGLILVGHDDVISHNVIADIGRNSTLDYAKHGVYVKGANVAILHNRITDFGSGSGVSLRNRDARVVGNVIGRGFTGVGFYRETDSFGVSAILRNRMFRISRAAFYYDAGGGENFVVAGNRFNMADGTVLDLAGEPSRSVVVSGNRIGGTFDWAVSARYSPDVGYSEFKNAFIRAPMFAWGGHSLTYTQYRAQSGQGAGDVVGAS